MTTKVKVIIGLGSAATIAALLFFTRKKWLPLFEKETDKGEQEEKKAEEKEEKAEKEEQTAEEKAAAYAAAMEEKILQAKKDIAAVEKSNIGKTLAQTGGRPGAIRTNADGDNWQS